MAARVSKSITAASLQLKKNLKQYNAIPGVELLTWQDVTNLSSPLWLFDVFNNNMQQIPKSIKLAAITNHHLILRADEEIDMLKQEMTNTLQFYKHELEALNIFLEESNTSTLHGEGAKCLRHFEVIRLKSVFKCCVNNFSPFLADIPLLQAETLTSKLEKYPNDADAQGSTFIVLNTDTVLLCVSLQNLRDLLGNVYNIKCHYYQVLN